MTSRGPKLGLKLLLPPSSDIRLVRVGCTASLQSVFHSVGVFLLHTLSLCFSRRVRHSRPDISASGRQRHLRLLHKHLQLRPRSGESPHRHFVAREEALAPQYIRDYGFFELGAFELVASWRFKGGGESKNMNEP